MTLYLVYQCGIANVFEPRADGREHRVMQANFRTCEQFCRGAQHAGAAVEVRHCDVAGDIAGADWKAGQGSMFAEAKRSEWFHHANAKREGRV